MALLGPRSAGLRSARSSMFHDIRDPPSAGQHHGMTDTNVLGAAGDHAWRRPRWRLRTVAAPVAFSTPDSLGIDRNESLDASGFSNCSSDSSWRMASTPAARRRCGLQKSDPTDSGNSGLIDSGTSDTCRVIRPSRPRLPWPTGEVGKVDRHGQKERGCHPEGGTTGGCKRSNPSGRQTGEPTDPARDPGPASSRAQPDRDRQTRRRVAAQRPAHRDGACSHDRRRPTRIIAVVPWLLTLEAPHPWHGCAG